MARLAGAQGARPSALVVGVAMTFCTSAFAASAASAIAPLAPADGRLLLAALAIALAGLEMLMVVPSPAPKEPTQSLGALAFVIAAHQLTDATRFLIFAIALLMAAPLPTGLGGAVGGAMTLAAAWLAPGIFDTARVRPWRRIAGAALLVIAAVQLLRL